MICKQCGTYNEEGSVICGMCGAPFSEPPKKNIALIIAGVLGVFLVAAIAVIVVLATRGSKPAAPAETAASSAGYSTSAPSTTAAATTADTVSAAAPTDPADDHDYDADGKEVDGMETIPSSFYGIFCSAYKNYDDAEKDAEKLRGQGFSGAEVYYTTDWSNLNTEPWYVVVAGAYTTKSAADAALPEVKAVYGDAYVKYSGDYQGP